MSENKEINWINLGDPSVFYLDCESGKISFILDTIAEIYLSAAEDECSNVYPHS